MKRIDSVWVFCPSAFQFKIIYAIAALLLRCGIVHERIATSEILRSFRLGWEGWPYTPWCSIYPPNSAGFVNSSSKWPCHTFHRRYSRRVVQGLLASFGSERWGIFHVFEPGGSFDDDDATASIAIHKGCEHYGAKG